MIKRPCRRCFSSSTWSKHSKSEVQMNLKSSPCLARFFPINFVCAIRLCRVFLFGSNSSARVVNLKQLAYTLNNLSISLFLYYSSSSSSSSSSTSSSSSSTSLSSSLLTDFTFFVALAFSSSSSSSSSSSPSSLPSSSSSSSSSSFCVI